MLGCAAHVFVSFIHYRLSTVQMSMACRDLSNNSSSSGFCRNIFFTYALVTVSAWVNEWVMRQLPQQPATPARGCHCYDRLHSLLGARWSRRNRRYNCNGGVLCGGTSWGWRNSWAPTHKTTQDSTPTVEINVWFALRLNELKQSRQGSRYQEVAIYINR